MGDKMGKGRRIQDFRNLNLESSNKNDSKLNRKNNIRSSIKKDEFIIEVEEKDVKQKKDVSLKEEKTKINNRKIKKEKNKTIKSKNPKSATKKDASLKNNQSPITYVEKEYNKKKKEEKKNTSIIVSSFLLIFIAIGIIAGCLTTPTFDVVHIEAMNGQNVTSGEIQKYFSGIKGKNTFLVNISETEKSIETHPYIYKAKITRKLPNGLEVNYIERNPYAIIKYIESYVLIDKYGYILEIKKENENYELPIIYGIETDEFIPGQKLSGTASLKFENSVYLLETAEHVNFDYVVSEINYTNSEEVRLSINEENIQIVYGKIQKEILSDKIAYLNEIIKELNNKKGTLDISSENYSEKVIFTEILK
ncbi:MAG: FtsQ-type POTRA domain-containing protein [Clostridia bacterium]|nr:FtsQ-type POTRA domain-containing protein [Clostridia bacterium]